MGDTILMDVESALLKDSPGRARPVLDLVRAALALGPSELHGPNKTRTAAVARRHGTGSRTNQFVAFTTSGHCSQNTNPGKGKVNIQVALFGPTALTGPGEGWRKVARAVKSDKAGANIVWWEREFLGFPSESASLITAVGAAWATWDSARLDADTGPLVGPRGTP